MSSDPFRYGMRKPWALGMAMLIGIAGFGWFWLSARPDAKPPEVSFLLRPEGTLAASGVVEPFSEEISIGNEVKGVLTRLVVQEGDTIAAGQVVAETSNGDLAADVKIAEAQLALRQAELTKLMNGARAEERRVAAANLREAEAALTNSKRKLERKSPLAVRGAISVEELDEAQSAFTIAEARRDRLAQQLSLINADPRAEDVSIAQANVKLAEANLIRASALLEKTIIRAPINGKVLSVLRRVGEPVAEFPPTIIIKMGDTSRLHVRAELDETNVARVKLNQHTHVTADAYGNQRFSGRVVKIANKMGRKALHSDDPAERLDAKVLDVLIELEPATILPIGLRVDVFIAPVTEPSLPEPTVSDHSHLGRG